MRGVEFRKDVTRSVPTDHLRVHSQYISLTLQYIDYLSRTFSVVEQQLGDYVSDMPDVLPYVTVTLNSLTYVEPAPDASKKINFPHQNEKFITFVLIPLLSANKTTYL
jgi:hypothetical protein